MGANVARVGGSMAQSFTYGPEAAAGYEQAFARVSTRFIPSLLRAAHIAPNMHVLDIATGTGLAAEAALDIVGPGGQIIAADISVSMTEQAGKRLGKAPNA